MFSIQRPQRTSAYATSRNLDNVGPMRTILITLALIATLSTQVWSENNLGKMYSDCLDKFDHINNNAVHVCSSETTERKKRKIERLITMLVIKYPIDSE